MSLLMLFSIFLLIMLLSKMAIFVVSAVRYHRRHRQTYGPSTTLQRRPTISVIVPCYNEEMVVKNCMESLEKQTYPELEIVFVDDGSTDNTANLINLQADAHDNVVALSKENGGKASALNYGIGRSSGEFVICMDADSVFTPTTVENLLRSFDDPAVGAVGGNVRVANRRSWMTAHQATEYITGLTIQRSAFAHLDCMQVISGAIGAFRRDALHEFGGYSSDTIVEDMDVTVCVTKAGYRVAYNPDAVAYTEAPENVRDFLKQRYRWTFGTLQVLAKHRHMLGNRKYGNMGLYGLPYCAIFPWVDALISVLLFLAVARVAMYGNGGQLLAFYLILTAIQGAMTLYALRLNHDNPRLVLMVLLEHIFYTHLINATTVAAGINYQLGKSVQWNKLKRLGKNVELVREEPSHVG